ncbi:anhydro-N-acetylmuramic acid kinase [bacterium]|nr:anhydro-N-acetylmuramic acid kinase [bacterium]
MIDVGTNKIKCLGIMNGTSIDGADFVLIEIDKADFSCVYSGMQSFSFPKKLKDRLLKAVQHKIFVNELALLHHDLGRYYADCFKKLKPSMQDVHLIGLHGQTVFHKGGLASLQIGESSYISQEANAIVVSDFRAGDIALGGQGAPIATFFHSGVFGKKDTVVSIHNLGGISNLSLINNGKLEMGFDTGPANMLIDMAVKIHTKERKQFDKDGNLARKGKSNGNLVKKMLQHKFFKIKPPKSCGREEFGEAFYSKYKKELHKLKLEDRLATLTDFVAQSIAMAYTKHCKSLPREIIFCGGGANNKFLLEKISDCLPKIKISTTLNSGWPVQSVEGAAFAYLAAARGLSLNSNLPESTGARRGTSLGKITKV